ncbi:post-transcriptional regulator [Paenibacillus ferrarius]|uniref:post-transcriptional regulator n=1 Tax=Paenibacillus ferrarius TaxID=1469647 RepID=UPI003D265081
MSEEERIVSEEEDGAGMTDHELNEIIEGLCASKAEEFVLLGYDQVTGKDIWDCVNEKYRKTGMPSLHQIVNDILSLKTTQFMNWMTISMYRGTQF